MVALGVWDEIADHVKAVTLSWLAGFDDDELLLKSAHVHDIFQ
jgi:hypothetical protein